MVNVGSKGHHDGRSDTLLQKAAQLALGVDLGSESGHAEIVLGTNGSDTLLLQAAAHQTTGRGDKAEAQVNTSLNLVGQLAPVRSVESSHSSLQLSGGDPVGGLVSGAVRDGTFGTLSQSRALPEGFQTESELRGDGLQVTSDVDASRSTLEERGVEHLERGTEVITGVFMFELGHVLAARGDGELRFGNQLVGPSVVETAGEGAFVVHVALAEDLIELRVSSAVRLRATKCDAAYLAGAEHGGESVRVDALTHCELVRDLEQRRHAEDLCEVGADAGEHVIVEEDIALDFLGQGLYCAGIRQAELCPPLRKVVDGISYCGGDGVGEYEGPQCVDGSGHDAGICGGS